MLQLLQTFLWDDYTAHVENHDFPSDVGTAEDCRNLLEAGWQGYDSDKEGVFEDLNPRPRFV